MKYFDIFSMPVSFFPSQTEVNKKFYALAKIYHPDKYMQASKEKQDEANEQTALLHQAYQTLTHFNLLLPYILKELRMIYDDEKYNLPPNFLMDMLSFHESLEESKDIDTQNKIKSQIQLLQNEMYESIKKNLENYSQNTTQEELLQIKEYYYKNKYILRMLQAS